MAGIGFVLRKLLKKDDLTSVAQAYLHAMLASCGPWLMTIAALGTFFIVSKNYVPFVVIENFRIIILYNFSFSLLFSSPFTILATRYLADLIYQEDLDNAVGMMFGSLIALYALTLPAVAFFYLSYANLEFNVALLSIANFVLIAGIWQTSIFISAVKNYTGVTISFVLGMLIALVSAIYLADYFGIKGMIGGFNLGLAFILSSIIALVFAEYPKNCMNLFRFLGYCTKYWEIAVGGIFYNLAIWVDKWIMWLAPEAVTLPNKLIMFPMYDSAMFIAYLTIVPSMAMFMISQETTFFEYYHKYYKDIQNHANLAKIEVNLEKIVQCIKSIGRNIMVVQVTICLLTLLAAPKIFDLLGLNFVQLGIFRFGVLGATFQVFTLLYTILLSYFDYRRGALYVQMIFFVCNTVFTFVSLKLGFAYYGFGYFMAALVSFVCAAVIAERYANNLTYHTFIETNTSI